MCLYTKIGATIRNGMENTIVCPKCNGRVPLTQTGRTVQLRGEDLDLHSKVFIVNLAKPALAQLDRLHYTRALIADAYREKVGLLTGEEIRKKREELGISQKKLAEMAGIGIASIKRWENGIIQTKSMDAALKLAFRGKECGNNYTGNRSFSIRRVKLVMKEFEKILPFEFLQEGDRMLFDAKYSWYGDFLAYQELGKSLTGATYAALPHGPQINNYGELVDEIRNANIENEKPLTNEEEKIIARVALTFPSKQSVIDAAHRERVFRNKATGQIIPYTDASKLTEIQLSP